MSKINSKQWTKVKEIMKEGLKPSLQSHMDVLLDNTLIESARMNRGQNPMLFENAADTVGSTGNIAAINQVILPLIRRVMPGLIANELVGVQPMDGPFALIRSLRPIFSQTNSGVSAGSEMFSPRHVNSLAIAYSGNENTGAPGAALTSALEGVPGNAVSFEIVKKQVEAGTRKLRASWTIEAAQDAESQHKIDYQEIIMDMCANKIVVDIDQEILAKLRSLPPTPGVKNTFDQSALSGSPIFVGDELAVLAILLTKEANDIGTRTRQSVGNFAVVSSEALTVLQAAKSSMFAQTTKGDFEGPVNVKYVGTLNNQLKVYVDPFAQASAPVLVGLKENDVNCGMYYCPYVPLMATPAVINPQNMDQVVGFMSRYALVTMDSTADSLGNSADYYGLVGINATELSFL